MKRTQKTWWEHLSDEELLQSRIADLKLTIEGTDLENHTNELYAELDAKNIVYHPPCYLADEWFVLEGSTAIGIPFYLAHPRLKTLEEKMMLEAEGGTPSWCLKLLRHEAGHALFYAYGFSKRKIVQRTFGRSPKDPPETYRPKPYSKSFVQHLDNWYAQAEPDEDFAETFAVWLTPGLDWRVHYRGWPALKKLELMERLMNEVSGAQPRCPSIEKNFEAKKLRLKLMTYYQRKQKLYAQDYPDFYDRELKSVFSSDGETSDGESAYRFLKRNRRIIIDKVARWSREKKITVNNLYRKLMERSQELSLKVGKNEAETQMEITAFLTAMAANYLYTGRFKPSV
jgi:hypothetical protein